MPRVTYQIDVNADTVIILRNPNASFAPWTSSEAVKDAAAFVDNSAIDNLRVNASGFDRSAIDELTVNGTAGGDADEEGPAQVAQIANDSSETEPTDIEEDEIWYHVSRRHLTSASTTWKHMLSESWKEGNRNDDDGLYHTTSEDWDSEALLYVLQILHHRNRPVPRTVSLEMMAKVAVLVDFYKCEEALELFTEKWIEHLRASSPVPSEYCRDLMLWMCIAWVLKLPNEFTQTMTVAIRREAEELQTLGLPIMACVDKIEESRIQAISNALTQLQDLRQEFRDPLYHCPSGFSFECGSMLYGALTKEMELQGLLPVPLAPFSGLRISELYTKMQNIRSPSWCLPNRSKKSYPHSCRLDEKVMEIAEPFTRLANGPELKDFEVN